MDRWKNIASNKLIICISREHGTGGKEIARKVAEKDSMIKQAETIKLIASRNNCVKDTHKEAEKHVVQSDKSRASYYEIIAN